MAVLSAIFIVPAMWAGESSPWRVDSLRWEAEVHATFSGGASTPFWLVSNTSGLGSPEKNNGYVRGALFKDMDESRRLSWGAGIALDAQWRGQAPFQVHQLYAEMKYRSLDVLVGSKVMPGPYSNPRLASGNMLFSDNALPIPQVRVGIFDYAGVWGCRDWFSVRGYLSYGYFTDGSWQRSWAGKDSKYTQDVLFHSKGLWLKGGNSDKFPLTGEVGIEMATQFGGTAFKDGKVVHLRHGLKQWLHALMPTYTQIENFKGDARSVEGNMVGAYNIAIYWTPKADWSIKGYYQHFFEDESQMTFEYGWKDGLWGIEAQLPENPFVRTVVAEYLYTKDQTGPVFVDANDKIPEQVSGRDNYYNHSVYSGWQHWGMGIGNPLLLSPIFNTDHNMYFNSTRVIGYHLGFEGCPTPQLGYRVLLSHTRNWGTYFEPTPEVLTNYMGLMEVTWHPEQFKGWHASVSVAGNTGTQMGRSLGFALTVGKSGLLNFGNKKKGKEL